MDAREVVKLLSQAAELPRPRGPLELGRSLSLTSLAGHRYAPGDRVRDVITGQEGQVVLTSTRHVAIAAPIR